MNSPKPPLRLRKGGPVLTSLTAYDYPTARLLDEAGIELILVGDSLGMVVAGLPDTTKVTLSQMEYHTSIVARAVRHAVIIGDLPWGTYATPEAAVNSAQRLMDAGAHGVKLEGGTEQLPQIRAIIAAGIPFLGHIGMLPQQVLEEGGYKKKGKSEAEAKRLLQSALDLDAAGAIGMVLESVVPSVAATITQAIGIPTIGIGSGSQCDGQIRVVHDIIGAFPWFRPPFAQPHADVAGAISQAAKAYINEVRGH
ncbi:MAG: 3-methyl-2-oxobutanoate hydroxymethyltransferase [Akkermansiaceae bacterium]|nr:3-methyl-2-oxobutanoate hydroxymethyltransferase [Akkermansiaceae bacterium]